MEQRSDEGFTGYVRPATFINLDSGISSNSLHSSDGSPLNMVMDNQMLNSSDSSFNMGPPPSQNSAYYVSSTQLHTQGTNGSLEYRRHSYDSQTTIEAADSSSKPKHELKDGDGDLQESSAKGKERRRRQKLPDKQNMFCAVCGDRANGFNFGALTCESCKAFFRRNALKTKEIVCAFENDCKIDPFTRKFCTACRLGKCLSIDMKKEWILDEDALKKRKRLTRKSKDGESSQAVDSTVSGSGDHSASSSRDDSNSPAVELCEADVTEINDILYNHKMIDEEIHRTPTSPDTDDKGSQGKLLHKQKTYHSRNYRVDTAEYEKLTDNPESAVQLLQMISGFIIRFIPFIKLIPAYDELKRMEHGLDDQVILIKQSIHEVMALRSAIQYNPDIDGFELEESSTGEKKAIKMDVIRHMLGDELFDAHMKFITTFNNVAKWDKPTMIITMVINLFASDRVGLHNKEHVSQTEEHYSFLLQALLRSMYTLHEARTIYPKLLMMMTEVRSYGELAKKTINHLDVNFSQLDPLLRELLVDGGLHDQLG